MVKTLSPSNFFGRGNKHGIVLYAASNRGAHCV